MTSTLPRPALTRVTGTKPVRWTTILGLILVPLTVAGVLLWGLWNPSERLDTITAAVVNNDVPVEVDGQTVPLGRVLAGELIGGDAGSSAGASDDEAPSNFTWMLTDEDDAEQGLKDGRYATVITIPENFSAAATSLSEGPEKAETAHIDISESDQGRLIDTALSGIVTQTATSVLNQQLGSQFVGNIFVGMTELGNGIGEAADGASQLADGGTQLADGASQLADGTAQLSDGVQELSSGTTELSTGAGALSTGAGALATGTSELATGAGELAAGVRLFATGDGAANPGMAGLAANLNGYTAGVNEALTGLQQGAGGAIAPLTGMRDLIAAGIVPPGDGQTVEQAVAGLNQLIEGFTAASAPDSQLEQLKAGGTALAAGTTAAASGAEQLAAGAEGLAGGAAQLSTGASQLAAGTAQLSTGVAALATGTSELAANTPELADGAAQLADGATQSADGAGELAKGLGEAVAGIPNYTQAESESLAETAVAPVEARGASDELFNASGVPLFAGIALWAGALAMFLVLSPLWRRTTDAARGVGSITVRSALPALALGALQGAIAGVVLPIALGYDLGQGLGFFGLALLAGIAFSLVVQGLSALLGGFGRFIAFALLVVAFAVGIVSTVPGPLAAIGDASPIGAAFSGFQAIASGADGADGSALVLALWACAGLALTAFAVVRARSARH
ncbi:YhgE/Pip domain-containing protein [Leucobacter rhizosphaerae]|uniref:YhgE/Pip domain-containing protein n=1 Tax=Leucobacter rhizosphaerae TaxID=2932245 RepID=A0ABY4FSE0_9MICO|nr:YhgE/Pip domain-containing protein [Leucobacter rhizosphaerae]UOQ59201.1 YhgE/Pip domain-containing protein [Leucobacter rhizosphaerae]